MPDGWQKAQTDKGEIYFINHNTMSTQWDDPRIHLIPGYLKRQQQQQQQPKHQQYQNGQQINSNQYPNNFQGAPSNSVSPFDNPGMNSSVASSYSSSSSINEQALSCALGSMPIDDLNSLLNPLNPNQEDIKTLILQVISKKQDLFKTLEDLNKQEAHLRAQLTAALDQDHSSLNLSAEEFEIITNLESTITSGEATDNSGVLGDSNKSNMKVNDDLGTNCDANKLADLDQMSSLYNKMLINNARCGQTTSVANPDGDKENSSSGNYLNSTGECVDNNNEGSSNANNTNNNTIIEDL